MKGLFPLGCSHDHAYTHCGASDHSDLMDT